MTMTIILLIIGFALLVKGADFLVDGSVSIAKKLNVPTLVIGLTIVAFGTSAPEAAVSIKAALNEANGLALGNVVGSNLINTLLILGISAMMRPIRVQLKTIVKETPFVLLASIVLMILIADTALGNASSNFLSKADGFILLTFFAIYMYTMIEVVFLAKESDQGEEYEEVSNLKSMFFFIGGLVGVLLGAHWVVESSTVIARVMGMSETMIGLTVVAFGTSLPELVTSVVAAKKNENDLAVGNILGSNVFNLLFVLGISSTLHPIAVDSILFVDVPLMVGSMVLLMGLMYTGKRLSRAEGVFMTALYFCYFAYIMIRQFG